MSNPACAHVNRHALSGHHAHPRKRRGVWARPRWQHTCIYVRLNKCRAHARARARRLAPPAPQPPKTDRQPAARCIAPYVIRITKHPPRVHTHQRCPQYTVAFAISSSALAVIPSTTRTWPWRASSQTWVGCRALTISHSQGIPPPPLPKPLSPPPYTREVARRTECPPRSRSRLR